MQSTGLKQMEMPRNSIARRRRIFLGFRAMLLQIYIRKYAICDLKSMEIWGTCCTILLRTGAFGADLLRTTLLRTGAFGAGLLRMVRSGSQHMKTYLNKSWQSVRFEQSARDKYPSEF